MSKEQVIERATKAMRDGEELDYEALATYLYEAGVLVTPEMEACVAACEALDDDFYNSGHVIECRKAGRASLAAKEPKPRYVVRGGAERARVMDSNYPDRLVSEFYGPNAEARARADAERLNGRATT
jgi:hypothetical protein